MICPQSFQNHSEASKGSCLGYLWVCIVLKRPAMVWNALKKDLTLLRISPSGPINSLKLSIINYLSFRKFCSSHIGCLQDCKRPASRPCALLSLNPTCGNFADWCEVGVIGYAIRFKYCACCRDDDVGHGQSISVPDHSLSLIHIWRCRRRG